MQKPFEFLKCKSMRLLGLKECWAKTDESGQPALTLRDHSIHVGSVGREVLSRLPPATSNLPPHGSFLLIAGHDIGKLSPGFLMKCNTWRSEWQNKLGLLSPESYEGNHAKLSQRFFAQCYNQDKPPMWLLALGGHHGRYFCQKPNVPKGFGEVVDDQDWVLELRQELLGELRSHFGGLPETGSSEKNARLHWLTGLVIFCDWIGSNTTWFPLHESPAELETSSTQARTALDDIGWSHNSVKPSLKFPDLFGFDSPRPLQEALTRAAEQSGLFIIEAPTGDGKTEAALGAAYRRWTQGTERGLYFALPTQLTSNRIHDRVMKFLANVISDSSAFSLVHGSAWLNEKRIRALQPNVAEKSEIEDQAEEGNRWFSDTRRSLLAPFGVGTIDQALMSVLPVKFSALRLFALSGKVVVIDEVHSYDPYTSAFVDRLVEWLIELGCSIIILSATLTTQRRQSLLKAAGIHEPVSSKSYPLITVATKDVGKAKEIEVLWEAHEKKVMLECLKTTESGWKAKAAQAAENGACVLVVRNTVSLAQQSYNELCSACRDLNIQFGCIHSRFTQADRERNEKLWMDRLDRNGNNRPSNGAVLVGTQVLEQSVDIDADILFTDLAPVDLILQRIGRLHRHQRTRPAGFDDPYCFILHPPVDWSADEKALKDQLMPHRFVYPPYSLYRASELLRSYSKLKIPTDVRNILDSTDKIPENMPKGMTALYQEMVSELKRMKGAAWANDVFKAPAVNDDEGTQTRWNMRKNAHLVLIESPPLQKDNHINVPFLDGITVPVYPGQFSFELARQLHRHAIRIPLYQTKDLLPGQPEWLKRHFPDAVLASQDETGVCKPCYETGSPAFSFTYRETTGLHVEKNAEVPVAYNEEEESWF